MATKPTDKNRNIAPHVLSGSTTMIGVCVTIIALFKALKASLGTYADEILGIDTFVFVAASLCAYASLRKENNTRMEWWADALFFTGMMIMLIVAVVIIFSAY